MTSPDPGTPAAPTGPPDGAASADAAQRRQIARVSEACATFLAARAEEVDDVSPAGAPLVETLTELTRGGKKLRAVLAWIGWRAAGGSPDAEAPVRLGAALELFQAAALIHDDVIDRSDTRRGAPSAHRRFEQLHRGAAHRGEAGHFGVSAAVLAGDLALSWAGQAFGEAQDAAAAERTGTAADDAGREARLRFHRMHTEVIAGQYLDVLDEVRAPAASASEALDRARRVLRHKSARYSTEHPLVLGAALAGAPAALRESLAAAALPTGEAFQLRDDLLGVFGDPETTGKPVGDDLREGKRTELIAHGLFGASEQQARELEAMLGEPRLTAAEVERAREILLGAGAVEAVEASIAELVAAARTGTEQLPALGAAADVVADLQTVADRLVRRSR